MAEAVHLISRNIIGPFKRAATHTHPLNVGTNPQPHSHDFDVKLTFEAANDKGVSLVYSPATQADLETALDDFFKGDFSGITCEEMCIALFNRVQEVAEAIKAKHKLTYDFKLHAVSARVVYDGTLDHPTGPVEYVVSRAPAND
jgi:hypothetical protein